ncbi:MAG: CapA family protein, partial [Chloroflexia bacterium]
TLSPTPTPSPTPAPTLPPPLPLGLRRIWRAATEDTVWAMGATDLQGDGRPELWAASYDHRFYLLRATGEISWTFSAAAPLYTALPADLDGDGRSEFLLGGDDNTLYALNGDGSRRWSIPLGGRITHLAVGELDGDGQPEVLAATWDGRLHILDAAGEPEGYLLPGGMPAGIALADLDADGTQELILGSEDGQFTAMKASGQVLWQHGLEGALRGLQASDWDGDGLPELLVGSQRGLVVLVGTDGAPRWARRLDDTLITLLGVPAEEWVLVGLRGGVAALSARDGRPLWKTPTERGIWALAVAKEEGEAVILAGSDGGEILLLNALGQVRGRMLFPSRVHGLAALDLDGDGTPEVLARSGDYLYALALDATGEEGEAAPRKVTMPYWPTPSPLPPPAEGRITLVAAGDLMLSRSIEERMRAYGVLFPFQVLAPLLQEADIAVGNLECALTQGGEPAGKTYTFRAHPDMAAGPAQAGFDLLSLANNHALDYGAEGLNETLAALEAYGIRPVGAGPQAEAPVILEVRGLRVAFLARNVIGSPQEGIAWGGDEEALRRDVRRAGEQADVVVLLLHAGQEYAAEVTPEQRRLAHAAVEAGAALVIDHHTHTTLETERYLNGLIAYGLGDLVFDIDIVDAARDGALLRVVLGREGVVRADWIPTRLVDDVQPRPLAVPGGRVAVTPLLVRPTEPLPPPPSPRPAYVLSATVEAGGTVRVKQEIGFPNTSGDALGELALFVFPNAYTGTFFLREVQITQNGVTSSPSYALAGPLFRLFLPQRLLPGEAVTVTLAYSLSLPTVDEHTWPPQAVLGKSGDGRVLQLGHWYPQLVPYRTGYGWRTWAYHPVGDPFISDLADYRVQVQAPAGYAVWGSGEREAAGGRFHFRLEAGRDFALFLAREYLESRGEVNGTTVVSAYRREHEAAGQAVLGIVQRALALFEERYGPYPYAAFTVVEGEMDAGMEYSTLVMVGTRFYADYAGEPASVLPALAAHELAHQWWYGIVGNDQVYEPWLDEALARYSELLFYEAAYPKAVDWWWETRVDRRNPSGPLDRTIYDFSDPHAYVNDLYGQGARFLRDLRKRLGEEAFFAFLQRYYRENAWQRATRRDFFRPLNEMGVDTTDLVRLYFQR